MTREQAIEVLKNRYYSGVTRSRGDDEWRLATDTAIDALRGQQPDPITSLMPCGCGGVTEQTDFHDGFFPYSRVECLECGIQMMRAGDTFLEAHAEVKRDWNTAMGWKGGAE